MREAARDPGPGLAGSTAAAGRTAPGGSTAADSVPRVVIVDDHHLFRSGVRAELGAELEVVGDAGTVEDAVALIREQRPDVVLLDVHMPDGGGVEVIARLSDECQDIRFLALSVSDAAEDVIAVIRAGARGYVTKTISAAELAEAVRRVAAGDAVFSPRLAGFVLDAFAQDAGASEADASRRAADERELDQLTPREREVLRHIARGYMYKEVAQSLGISVKTVEAHVSAVLRKLQLSSRHELSRWAVQRRLVSLDGP
jgi:RNA polymerase sigma factor (sigma-70 family)